MMKMADRTERMESSIIREILKLIGEPGMISLAGGLPSPEAFPVELVNELSYEAFRRWGSAPLQYAASEGFGPLREAVSVYLREQNPAAEAGRILAINGSQQILDLVAKLLLNPGDQVALESPTYLGALQAFNPYQPRYAEMESDEEGLIPESLEEVLNRDKPKFVYLVPTFQNPTGKTLGNRRREVLAAIIRRYDIPVIEDDPYGAIRYRGEAPIPLAALAPEQVLYTGTFSKTFAPGLRLGYVLAPQEIFPWLVKAKQSSDLHTGTYVQALAALYLEQGHMARQIEAIIELYRPRQEAMLNALARSFPASFRFTRPDGGMFVWAEGPEGFDSLEAYHEAVKSKVAFVPGRFFYARSGAGAGTLRMNFTNSSVEQIETAVERLGLLFHKILQT